MATSREILKTYFQAGDEPTQDNFAELIDSLVHRDDDFNEFIGEFAEVSEAQQGQAQDKYMSPFLTLQAIKSLVRLNNIPELNSEVNSIVNTAINNLLNQTNADSVINTIKEVIDAFNSMPEGNTLIELLQGKANVNHTHQFSDITDISKSDIFWLNQSNVLASTKATRALFDTRRNSTNYNSPNHLATSKAVRDAKNQCSIVYHLGNRIESNWYSISQVGKIGDIGRVSYSNNGYEALYIKFSWRYWVRIPGTRTDDN